MENSKGKINIEIHSVLRDIVRNVWVIVLSALIGLMGIFIAEKSVYSPEYTSSATIAVLSKVNNNTTYTNLKISSEMAEIFAKIFEQSSMKAKAAEYIGADKFDGKIEASVLPNTNLLQISVVSSSPITSYRLIKAVMQVYPEISDSVFTNAVLNIMKEPQIPQSPSNHISRTNKCIAAFACAVFALCVVVVLSVIRDTVKNEAAFNDKIESNLLGTVVHEKARRKLKDRIRRKKAGLLIGESTYRSFKFTESYYKIATRIKSMNYKSGAKVFSIISFGENEGKSTAASNIAIALANYGHKVLLLDLDLKKPSIYKLFELKNKNESSQESSQFESLLSGKLSADEFNFIRYKKTGLYLAVDRSSYRDYPECIENGSIKNVIGEMKNIFDYVIIDTAPLSVDSTVTNLVKMVDKSIMIVRTDVVAASDINDAILTVNEVGGSVAGCVLNNVYPEFSLFNQIGTDESGYSHYNKGYGYSKYGMYGKYNRYAINMNNDELAEEEEQ